MAEKAFQGKWMTDKSYAGQGFDEAMDALGLQDSKEFWRDSIEYMTYDIKGDNWKCTVTVDKMPDKETVYDMMIGKEFETIALTGGKAKATLYVVDEKTVKEVHKMQDVKNYEEITITRVLQPDGSMLVTTLGAGKTMVFKMKKC